VGRDVLSFCPISFVEETEVSGFLDFGLRDPFYFRAVLYRYGFQVDIPELVYFTAGFLIADQV